MIEQDEAGVRVETHRVRVRVGIMWNLDYVSRGL